MTVFHAAGMPGYRRDLVQFMTEGWMPRMLAGRPGEIRTPYDSDGRPVGWDEYGRMVARWLRVAELFFVAPSMSAVVRQAASAAPAYRVFREDLPAPVGLVVYADPVAGIDPDQLVGVLQDMTLPNVAAVQIRGFLWAPAMTDRGPGVHVVVFADADELLTVAYPRYLELRGDTDRLEERIANIRRTLGALAYYDECPLPYAGDAGPVRNEAYAAIMSTWLIMGQRIAVTETERLPRQLRRQAARLGEPEPVVRTITLRRAARPGHADEDGQGPKRQYHHTWIVHGFWRQQWYPSEQRHKPIYIADYVKGPEGAPMIGGERVSVLRR